MADIITDLDILKRLAAERADDYDVLRYLLQDDDGIDDATLDALVDEVAAPVVEAVDCTACGNCCQSLDVYLTPGDVRRLAEGVDVPADTIEARLVDRDRAAQVEEWGVFKQKPCLFLCGKRCSVYPHRPDSCRAYPVFTPDFRWTLDEIAAGAGMCPIIYNVLEAVIARVDEAQRQGEL